MEDESKEEIKEFLKNAQKLTGFLPIIILTKRYLGDVTTVKQQFKGLGMEQVFPVENYTSEDHIKTPKKDKTFLSILNKILDHVNFLGKEASSFGTQEEQHLKRVQMLLEIAHKNEKEKEKENLKAELDKKPVEKKEKFSCKIL